MMSCMISFMIFPSSNPSINEFTILWNVFPSQSVWQMIDWYWFLGSSKCPFQFFWLGIRELPDFCLIIICIDDIPFLLVDILIIKLSNLCVYSSYGSVSQNHNSNDIFPKSILFCRINCFIFSVSMTTNDNNNRMTKERIYCSSKQNRNYFYLDSNK